MLRGTGTPSLHKAINTAKTLFQSTSRPDANKILVIFSDVRSGSDPNNVIQSAKNLQESDVQVIVVPLGATGSPDELKLATADKDDVLPTRKTENPKDVREKIFDRIFNSK